MNRKIRLYAAVTLVALFVAGCSGPCDSLKSITAPALRSGSADFATYVAMGTSISAGGQSGGLVETHQAHAFPALFARQVGMSPFTYARITADGIPPLLRLVSLSPLEISNEGRTMGAPRTEDLAQGTAFHNLGIYGSVLYDVGDSTRYYLGGDANPYSPYFGIVVRHRGTILSEAASLNPTFISLEYGANEVLSAALVGSGTPAFSVGQFTAILNGTLAGMAALMPDAKLAICNVPDVTSIPYVTTVKPYVVSPAGTHIPLIGPEGPLSESDYLLLTAIDSLNVGTGVPIPAGGNGRPLLGRQVLDADEAASLQTAVDGYNTAIAAAASGHAAALVDLNTLLRQMATTGFVVGGVRYTAAFISGGLFSLDGVHPTDLAQGIIANAMIQSVNARFGASVPLVDLRDAASWSASRARPAIEESGGWPRIEGLDEVLRYLVRPM